MTLVEVSMRVRVNPTECKEKVVTALKNVFGDIALEGSNRGGFTVLEAIRRPGVFESFQDLLRRMRISMPPTPF